MIASNLTHALYKVDQWEGESVCSDQKSPPDTTLSVIRKARYHLILFMKPWEGDNANIDAVILKQTN